MLDLHDSGSGCVPMIVYQVRYLSIDIRVFYLLFLADSSLFVLCAYDLCYLMLKKI